MQKIICQSLTKTCKRRVGVPYSQIFHSSIYREPGKSCKNEIFGHVCFICFELKERSPDKVDISCHFIFIPPEPPAPKMGLVAAISRIHQPSNKKLTDAFSTMLWQISQRLWDIP
mmetsp:Transcript_33581/g.52017  ORF Transcript_33581/g.52017 Transcript_33581/m.52017 type:complete len:115 (+) Transcript_33581:208-552(+)